MSEDLTYGEPIVWTVTSGDKLVGYSGFCAGLRFNHGRDFREIVSLLPKDTVICDSLLCAGLQHIRSILLQATKSWEAGMHLARNRSLDLLMRITLRSQISEAIEVSNISIASKLVIFGIANGDLQARSSYLAFINIAGDNPSRDDSILELTSSKAAYLKRLHNLEASSDSLLLSQLVEVSSLLGLK